MGAIIASVEALGLTKKEKNSLYNTVFNSLKWIRPKFNGSLISTSKIEELLDSIFKNLTFSDLYRELSIIATNYHTGELTIFNRHNNIKIKDAILASIAVPSLFPPRKIGNELFVDGYVSSNLPLQSVDNNLINLIVNITGKRAFKNLSANELNSLSILGNLERSIRILIYNQTKVALKNFNREYILIEPDVSNYKTLSFNKFKEIKELGYKEAKESLCKKMKIQ
jgi:NTE family protein